ncbi:hypothetical protein B566_EDAN001329 [Ephemera danica]|nr:hypothetical protein B566_EDAN001329 [Ephemera danica]
MTDIYTRSRQQYALTLTADFEMRGNIMKNINFLCDKTSSEKEEFISSAVFYRSSPKHERFRIKEDRLLSFKQWPIALRQTPEDLASVGFFYTGTGDRVICFECNLGLKDWLEDDIPIEEHRRWGANCSFFEMDINRCRRCLSKHINTVIIPCGHMHSCTDCIYTEFHCKECDIEITAYQCYFQVRVGDEDFSFVDWSYLMLTNLIIDISLGDADRTASQKWTWNCQVVEHVLSMKQAPSGIAVQVRYPSQRINTKIFDFQIAIVTLNISESTAIESPVESVPC